MSGVLPFEYFGSYNHTHQPMIDLDYASGVSLDLTELFSPERQFVDSFQKLAEKANQTNLSKGFDNSKTDDLVLHALIHSEVAEATEAVRKKKMDDKIPEFTGQEAELADVVIRIMTMSAAKKLRVAEAIRAKMEFNKTREFRHGDKTV